MMLLSFPLCPICCLPRMLMFAKPINVVVTPKFPALTSSLSLDIDTQSSSQQAHLDSLLTGISNVSCSMRNLQFPHSPSSQEMLPPSFHLHQLKQGRILGSLFAHSHNQSSLFSSKYTLNRGTFSSAQDIATVQNSYFALTLDSQFILYLAE